MKKGKILQVIGAMDYGGIETWLMEVLRRTRGGPYQIDFCCLSGRPGYFSPEIEELGSQIFPYRLDGNLVKFNSWLKRRIKAGQYDIVHSHVHRFSGYILWRAHREGVRGRISHSYTTADTTNRSILRLAYEAGMATLLDRYTTLGLGNSKASLEALFGRKWRQDPRLSILYCGIDVAPYAGSRDRSLTLERYGIPKDAIIIGHLGRLTEAKNHKFFLNVAYEITKRLPNCWFLILGDGELRAALQEQARELRLDRVVFAGRVSDQEVVAGLQSMDLFLFPSSREGLPQAMIQAQAAGVRCLCSENITPEVVVNPDAVRFMSLERNPAEWANECFLSLAGPRPDPDSAIRAVQESRFNLAESVDGLIAVYDSLMHP